MYVPGSGVRLHVEVDDRLGLVLRRLRRDLHRDRVGLRVLRHRFGRERDVLLVRGDPVHLHRHRETSRPASRSRGAAHFSSLPFTFLTVLCEVRRQGEERLLGPHRENERLVEPREDRDVGVRLRRAPGHRRRPHLADERLAVGVVPVALSVIAPVNGAASGATVSTSTPHRAAGPIVSGFAVTPAGSPRP